MNLSPKQIELLHARLDKDGIDKVKLNMANGLHGQKNSANYNCVEGWVKHHENAHAENVLTRAEAREKESIKLSRTASKHSKLALILSTFAVMVSIAGVLVAYLKQ